MSGTVSQFSVAKIGDYSKMGDRPNTFANDDKLKAGGET
jgi:hypothetical protein